MFAVDGREFVVSCESVTQVRSEDGRSVRTFVLDATKDKETSGRADLAFPLFESI